MSRPVRVQLQRTRGWRKPENTVVVARPSRWGNPFRVVPVGDRWQVQGFGRTWTRLATEAEATEHAVALFRSSWQLPRIYHGDAPLNLLSGKNLACWCPLDQPCHADVLLELANPEAG